MVGIHAKIGLKLKKSEIPGLPIMYIYIPMMMRYKLKSYLFPNVLMLILIQTLGLLMMRRKYELTTTEATTVVNDVG